MIGVWKRDTGWQNVVADYIIDDLQDLIKILKKKENEYDVQV